MSFGTRLTAIRKQKGLTQEALGKGLATGGEDASKSVVYGWEKDQHYPRVDQLQMICEKLQCSADYLLFGKESESSVSIEALSVAREIDALPTADRKRVLLLCNELLKLARESATSSVTEAQPEPPNVKAA